MKIREGKKTQKLYETISWINFVKRISNPNHEKILLFNPKILLLMTIMNRVHYYINL